MIDNWTILWLRSQISSQDERPSKTNPDERRFDDSAEEGFGFSTSVDADGRSELDLRETVSEAVDVDHKLPNSDSAKSDETPHADYHHGSWRIK